MKKLMGLIVSLVLLTGLLAGCAGTPAENNNTSAPASTETSEPDKALWPRTITDAAGYEVVLERQPERVTLLHTIYMEYFLLLDSPPTASAIGNVLGQMESLEESEMLGPYLENTDMMILGSSKNVSLEAVLASEPDVIVTFHNPAGIDIYDQLVEIAPVIQINFNDPWQDQLMLCAQLLGKEAEAQTIIAEIENIIADTKEALASDADRTFALFRTDGKGFIAQGTAQYYEIFGLTKPTGFTDAAETVSLEAVAEMNPYYIVFQHNYDIAKAFVDSMESSSVWQSLDAVQNGRIYYFDEKMNSFGPLALRLAAEKFTEIYSQ